MDNEAAAMRKQMDETMADLTHKIGELEHQVSGTVKTVKESVNTVRETFDVKHQVRRRPWTLVAGATALGVFAGYRANRRGGTIVKDGNDAARVSTAPAPGLLASLGGAFKPELAELKGIVIGALLGIARDVITQQVRKPIERSLRGSGDESDRRLRDDAGPGRL